MTRAGRFPVVQRVLAWRWVTRLASVRALALTVDRSVRFAVLELSGSHRAASYRIRSGGARVVVRHNSTDVWTLAEVFHLRSYEPPPPVEAWLRSRDRPLRVLDLGANVGMYGALVASRYPDAEIRAYEPDLANLAVHRRCMELNGSPSGWTLHEACAATSGGTLTFAARGDDTSAVTRDGSGVEVSAVDVLPEMAGADIVKVDIEGSEWPLLADPRFGEAASVVLEYHPDGCPGDNAREAAARLMRAAGYEVQHVFHKESGVGALWGWRPGVMPSE